jgi:raffinose/stachyose/melibiose transport system permease protein
MMSTKRKKLSGSNESVSTVRRAKHGWIWTVVFSVLSLLWIAPLLIVLLNSFKRKAFIFKNPFSISRYSLFSDGFEKWAAGIEKAFFGTQNYANGIQRTNFWSAFGCSLFITVFSVAAILLFCSMTAWYVVRVKTAATKLFYVLCLFSMIVPFQMVMFTLSKFANMLHLGNPVGIIVVYLGFGAGLAVFMFTGFVKSISVEIEEAAMIDGCSKYGIFARVILPLLGPSIITTIVISFYWIWDDYMGPLLYLGKPSLYTVSLGIKNFADAQGTNFGPMFAMSSLSLIPVFLLFLFFNRYLMDGVTAGSVKG